MRKWLLRLTGDDEQSRMARINIPRSEFAVLASLAGLPESSFSEFVGGLRAIEPSVSQFDLSPPLAKNVTSINQSELKSFLSTLFSLYRLSDSKERTPKELSSDIKEAIQREKPQGFTPENTTLLVSRLEELLNVGGMVATAAKAVDVASEQARLFCGARIISDIRPVFSDSPNSISAAIITHSLNISFHEGGKHQECYVALTTNELKTLKKVVERAEIKSESLKQFVQRSGIRLLSEGE